ncbi:carbohydrate porin [Endomicrobium proavitum]|uniref:Porin n=1 Tax=Endomicrobium proavitum TaxID=1408281 RepID=A0A0G3WIF0_9BACT|nr:carbohydrate porin [Endomicrobium proavitum]AKL98073.1 exported protein of unknown function [Endomicrobium proavitum]
MNKKIIAALVAALVVAGGNSSIFAQNGSESAADKLGLKISGGGTILFQGTPKLNDGSETSQNDATYSFDLKFVKELSSNNKIVIRFEGGKGFGLPLETYGWVNSDADPSIDPAFGHTSAKLTELYYEQTFLDGKLSFDIGKLNYWWFFDNNAYANNETSQFQTGPFVVNQLVNKPDRNVAAVVGYSFTEIVSAQLGYFANDLDKFDSNGLSVLQIDLKPIEDGTYRVYGWYNANKNLYNYKKIEDEGGLNVADSANIKTEDSYGFGLSADQKVTEHLGLFARVAYKKADAAEAEINSAIIDDVATNNSLLWNIGASINGELWSRANDTVGIAVGQIYGSYEYKKYINPAYKDGAETQAELYYSYALNDNFAITPAVQYFSNPLGGNATTKDDVVVYGIRTQFSF